ncbi:MAG: hypothetical protein OXG46_07495 [Chloroflexi bacterium]|nr:hypothetical protein [Chloroflexota bacterium]
MNYEEMKRMSEERPYQRRKIGFVGNVGPEEQVQPAQEQAADLSSEQAALGTIAIAEKELGQLLAVQGAYGFSCNRDRRVGPARSAGLGMGTDLVGRFSALDRIVGLMLEISPDGGRFYVKNAGVFLSRNDKQFVQFVN